jgi:S1-C subfamily serine protease
MRLDASAEGVVVIEVADGSAAQSLGFQRGDVVVTVNNEKIVHTGDLDRITKQPSRTWLITILRGGQQISVRLNG